MNYKIVMSGFFLIALGICVVLPNITGAKHDDGHEVITVFAAASLGDVLEYLAEEFERSSDVRVYLDFASSGMLRAKITAGAEADAFLSASVKDMDLLQHKDYIAGEKRWDLLSNSLICAVPVKSRLQINSANDLLDVRIRRIAIGEPEHVPAGIYTREAFLNMGLWNQLADKFVPCANVHSALAHVEMGTVEAAIVYATDIKITNKVKRVFTIPQINHMPIIYTCCVLKKAPHPDAADMFLSFLASSHAAKVFAEYGFEPIVRKGD